MSYTSVFTTFKIDHEACLSVKGEDDSKVQKINDMENDLKIIRWYPIFKERISNSYGSCRPFICFLREDTTAPEDVMDHLLSSFYYGERSSLISELESLLPHGRSILKNDNASV